MAKFLTLLCQSTVYDDFKGETPQLKALFCHVLVNLEITRDYKIYLNIYKKVLYATFGHLSNLSLYTSNGRQLKYHHSNCLL